MAKNEEEPIDGDQSDRYSLRITRPDLVQRVEEHLGPEFADMPVNIAAQFDPGDLGNCDPRIRAANKQQGQFTAAGGSGPVVRE